MSNHTKCLFLVILICLNLFSRNFVRAANDTNSSDGSGAFQERLAGFNILNTRPIIGILAQAYTSHRYAQEESKCFASLKGRRMLYIRTAMVKLMMGGGSRVVPILASGSENYLKSMFEQINGLVFPGGAASLRQSEYARAATILYKLAVKSNDAGIYFPILGECFGFQFLLFAGAGAGSMTMKGHRKRCNALDKSFNVNFTDEASTSRLYEKADESITKILTTNEINAHNHKYCITVEDFQKFEFQQKFRVLTTTFSDEIGSDFVSSTEAVDYPFYGLAFHPEANLYIWDRNSTISHSSEAVEVSHYFARFFVDESRKNMQKFPTIQDEEIDLISNQLPRCRGINYFFPR